MLFNDNEIPCAACRANSEVAEGTSRVGSGKFGLLPEPNRE
jgi:hypothetical protein